MGHTYLGVGGVPNDQRRDVRPAPRSIDRVVPWVKQRCAPWPLHRLPCSRDLDCWLCIPPPPRNSVGRSQARTVSTQCPSPGTVRALAKAGPTRAHAPGPGSIPRVVKLNLHRGHGIAINHSMALGQSQASTTQHIHVVGVPQEPVCPALHHHRLRLHNARVPYPGPVSTYPCLLPHPAQHNPAQPSPAQPSLVTRAKCQGQHVPGMRRRRRAPPYQTRR
jgi:hypothetical protein